MLYEMYHEIHHGVLQSLILNLCYILKRTIFWHENIRLYNDNDDNDIKLFLHYRIESPFILKVETNFHFS